MKGRNIPKRNLNFGNKCNSFFKKICGRNIPKRNLNSVNLLKKKLNLPKSQYTKEEFKQEIKPEKFGKWYRSQYTKEEFKR